MTPARLSPIRSLPFGHALVVTTRGTKRGCSLGLCLAFRKGGRLSGKLPLGGFEKDRKAEWDYRTQNHLGASMPYSTEISRNNPSCILFIIDRSGSMSDVWAVETGRKKADGLADIVNRLLQNLCLKCAKDEGIRNYYDVGVIGYGATVGPAFGGSLAGKDLVSIADVANSPAKVLDRAKKVEDGAGGLVEQTVKFPVWFEPVSNGATPMCQALTRANDVVSKWVSQHPSSFPPIVINITDGEATDGDPSLPASTLTGLSTNDGNVLLFNVHISSVGGAAIEFPDDETGLPDDHAKLLFRMSSVLPEYMRNMAQQESIRVSERTRGFVFQADMTAVIRFLDIGTRPSNLR